MIALLVVIAGVWLYFSPRTFIAATLVMWALYMVCVFPLSVIAIVGIIMFYYRQKEKKNKVNR